MARSVTRWVASIKGGPDGLLASGWDSVQLVPVMWRSADGSAWERRNASTDALGGSVGLELAWGSAGWVGVGATVDGAGQRLWRSDDGETWEPTGEPIGYTGWLAGSRGTYVSPGELDALDVALSLHIPPGVDASALEMGRWIEIVGHFRDEAAASCRIRPPTWHSHGGVIPADSPAFLPHLLESPASVQHDCRQRFVAESITAVDGP